MAYLETAVRILTDMVITIHILIVQLLREMSKKLVESSGKIHYKKACFHPWTTKAAARSPAPRMLSNL
jgi:hypothetical protein